jgi:hypothetical protein
MSGRDELLPYLAPISGLMDGDGCEWDCRDPLDRGTCSATRNARRCGVS